MRAILEERGVDTTGMRAKEMREILKTFPDFKEQKTILQDILNNEQNVLRHEKRGNCSIF